MNVVRVLALATVAVVFGACADPTPSPSASTTPDPVDLRYTCGTFPFRADELAGTGAGAPAAAEPAAALAQYLVDPDRLNPRLPVTGWHPIGVDATTAEFASIGADKTIWVTVVRREAAGWVVGSPDICQPLLVLPQGLARADWTFDPAQGPLTGGTRVFDALVTEAGCNSGQPADGRIVGPQVVHQGTDVLVVFAVRPRGGAQDCQSNPATRVAVDLGEPLGGRRLLDGGHLPYGDPTADGLMAAS